MTVNVINPDSAILQQSEGMWQKYCALLVWKLARQGVTISVADIDKCNSEGELILLAHGHYDSIEFKLVTPQQAAVIAAFERNNQRGHG